MRPRALKPAPTCIVQAATVSFGVLRGVLGGQHIALKPYENAVAVSAVSDRCRGLKASDGPRGHLPARRPHACSALPPTLYRPPPPPPHVAL